jgi:hypothetical protein
MKAAPLLTGKRRRAKIISPPLVGDVSGFL